MRFIIISHSNSFSFLTVNVCASYVSQLILQNPKIKDQVSFK